MYLFSLHTNPSSKAFHLIDYLPSNILMLQQGYLNNRVIFGEFDVVLMKEYIVDVITFHQCTLAIADKYICQIKRKHIKAYSYINCLN